MNPSGLPYDDDDETIAALLANEARQQSIKYSALGVSAFLPRSATDRNNNPKPNTRFLRAIVRDADAHNAALREKEAIESSARLRAFKERLGHEREDGEIDEYAHRSKRRRADEGRNTSGRSRESRSQERGIQRGDNSDSRRRGRRRSRSPSRSRSRDRHSRRKHGTSKREASRKSRSRSRSRSRSHRHKHSRDHKRHYDGIDSNGRDKEGDRNRNQERRKRHGHDRDHHRKLRSRSRSRSRSRNRTLSYDQKKKDRKSAFKHDEGSQRLSRTPSHNNSGDASPHQSTLSDSPVIGPTPIQPAPRPRGRGTITGQSAMDARFNASSAPGPAFVDDTKIATGTDKADSWDDTVASFRAHQKFKNAAADRLRAAGFTDEYVAAWEANRLRDEKDIKWTERGGVREWDRGKVIEGEVQEEEVILKAAWTQNKLRALEDA